MHMHPTYAQKSFISITAIGHEAFSTDIRSGE